MTRIHKVIDRITLRSLSRFSRKSFALNDLDLRLLAYLKLKNGFFIEVGANDGISQSNTMYFEKYEGWKGLLIEAIPELAEKCRHNRPRCMVEQCALVAKDYPEEKIEMHYCNLMSMVKGGMRSAEDEDKHLQAGSKFLAPSEQVYTVSVPARTLSQVLDKHRIGHVDLLSLDIEGYEAEALKGLDIQRHCPDFMLVEVRDRAAIDAVINRSYHPIAVLNINDYVWDILYRRK